MKKIIFSAIILAIPAFLLMPAGCKNAAKSKTDSTAVAPVAVKDTINIISQADSAQGWKLLFDGKTFTNWTGYNADSIPPRWQIKDGMLYTEGKKQIGNDKELTLDIMTRDQFENFELSWEWKITAQGNSGVMYHVEQGKYPETFATGPEYQLLDDKGWPEKLKAAQYSGSDYDMYPAMNATVKPVGEWNQSLIKVQGPKVEHWLNGVKVVEYELWSPDWKKKVKESKWKDYPGYGLSKTGHIALQDHGTEVYFRAIRIRPL